MRQGDQGVRLEPLLEAISAFLDDQRDVIECIRRDLVRGLKQPGSGRHGLTATQVLRSLVLMRLKNWDYRELRERIADGLTLRQFTDFYCAPVPKHDAFQRGFIRLTPQTLKAVSEQNLASCNHAGVKQVCIPQRGGKRTRRREAYESSAAFKNGQRFRAGIEGRISVLFRGRGMKRCLAEGRDRFELWVGAAVLANNLMRIGALLTTRSPRRRRAA